MKKNLNWGHSEFTAWFDEEGNNANHFQWPLRKISWKYWPDILNNAPKLLQETWLGLSESKPGLLALFLLLSLIVMPACTSDTFSHLQSHLTTLRKNARGFYTSHSRQVWFHPPLQIILSRPPGAFLIKKKKNTMLSCSIYLQSWAHLCQECAWKPLMSIIVQTSLGTSHVINVTNQKLDSFNTHIHMIQEAVSFRKGTLEYLILIRHGVLVCDEFLKTFKIQ